MASCLLVFHYLLKNAASAGNRTRIYCLEGNNANLYTTDADTRNRAQNYIYMRELASRCTRFASEERNGPGGKRRRQKFPYSTVGGSHLWFTTCMIESDSFSICRTSQCHREIQITFYVNLTCTSEKAASAGNRTRIYCLEGNNANLYTTDAVA